MIEKKNDDKQQTLTTGCFCFFIINFFPLKINIESKSKSTYIITEIFWPLLL